MGLCQSRNISKIYSHLPEKYKWIQLVEKEYDIDNHVFQCAVCSQKFVMRCNNGQSYCEDRTFSYHILKEDDNVFYTIVKSKQTKNKEK